MKVVVLHGLGQTAVNYEQLTKHLREKGIESLAIDLSLKGPFDQVAAEVKKTLGALEEPYLLFGLSLGGVISLSLADALPFCEGLILSGSQYNLKKNVLFRVQILVMSILPQSFYEKRGVEKTSILNLQKSMKQLDLTDKARRITLPTLIICGSNDRPNLKPAYELEKLIKNSKFLLIENGGHELNEEKPEELANSIEEFLKELKA